MLKRQSGVVSRRQLLASGVTDNDLRRLVRRHDLWRVHPGAFVDHNGRLTWGERAWAAVRACAPAALAGASALRAHSLPGHESRHQGPIELVVPADRRVSPPDGVRVSRSSTFDVDVQAHLSPPRQRLEVAAVRVAARATSTDAAVAVAADAVQCGRTTVPRLRAALMTQPRNRSTRLLAEILDDVGSGAYSALERRFLKDVERPHGLHTLVELDGRLGHEWSADRWSDLDRDLQNAVAGELTLRAGWRPVLQPCRLAGLVGAVLLAQGWAGPILPCGPGCQAPSGGLQSSDDWDPPATGIA